MIRFMPDTWWDAVMRPIAMAAPNGNVYVEIIAPDFRFVFALLLLVGVLVLRRRNRSDSAGFAAFALLAFCAAAFIPWLATSGNGRYFLAVLLLAGPLCVGLLRLLRVTRGLQATLVALMIGLQLFLVHANTPWQSWGLMPWIDEPAFAIDVPKDLKDEPATYVTLTSISYSLIAPQFHPDSRWINLTTQRGGSDQGADARRTRAFLAAAKRIDVLFPSLAGEGVLDRPTAELIDALDDVLGAHALRIDAAHGCRWLRSTGLSALGARTAAEIPRVAADQRGFWLCPLVRLPESSLEHRPMPAPKVEAVFEKIEQMCPRMFAPGESITALIPDGARRYYPNSDMRLFVLNDGEVMYKYVRALNMTNLGRIEDVMQSGFRMDCNNIRGRTGLPWEREI